MQKRSFQFTSFPSFLQLILGQSKHGTYQNAKATATTTVPINHLENPSLWQKTRLAPPESFKQFSFQAVHWKTTQKTLNTVDADHGQKIGGDTYGKHKIWAVVWPYVTKLSHSKCVLGRLLSVRSYTDTRNDFPLRQGTVTNYSRWATYSRMFSDEIFYYFKYDAVLVIRLICLKYLTYATSLFWCNASRAALYIVEFTPAVRRDAH